MLKPVVAGRLLQALELAGDEDILNRNRLGLHQRLPGTAGRQVSSIDRHGPGQRRAAALAAAGTTRSPSNVPMPGRLQPRAATTSSLSPAPSIPCRRVSETGWRSADGLFIVHGRRPLMTAAWSPVPTAATCTRKPCSRPNWTTCTARPRWRSFRCSSALAPGRLPHLPLPVPVRVFQIMTQRRLLVATLALSLVAGSSTVGAADLIEAYQSARDSDPQLAAAEAGSRRWAKSGHCPLRLLPHQRRRSINDRADHSQPDNDVHPHLDVRLGQSIFDWATTPTWARPQRRRPPVPGRRRRPAAARGRGLFWRPRRRGYAGLCRSRGRAVGRQLEQAERRGRLTAVTDVLKPAPRAPRCGDRRRQCLDDALSPGRDHRRALRFGAGPAPGHTPGRP